MGWKGLGVWRDMERGSVDVRGRVEIGFHEGGGLCLSSGFCGVMDIYTRGVENGTVGGISIMIEGEKGTFEEFEFLQVAMEMGGQVEKYMVNNT